MVNEKETICAVVVTYNRKELLLECLEALRKQTRSVQGIYLIDNASTDGTPKLLFEKGYIKELPPENLTEPWEKEFEIKNLTDGEIIKLHYVRIHENTGGAGGFHEGAKRAYEKGYDWLWLMDDDAEPKEDALFLLMKYKDFKNVTVICPLIVHKETGKIENNHHKIFTRFMEEKPVVEELNPLKVKGKILKIQANAFVGPLIHRRGISKAGFPMKELFIWGDDTEYTFRLNRSGLLLLVCDAIIFHKDVRNKSHIEVSKIYFFYKNKIIFLKKFAPYNKIADMIVFYKAIKSAVKIMLKKGLFSKWYSPIKGLLAGLMSKVS